MELEELKAELEKERKAREQLQKDLDAAKASTVDADLKAQLEDMKQKLEASMQAKDSNGVDYFRDELKKAAEKRDEFKRRAEALEAETAKVKAEHEARLAEIAKESALQKALLEAGIDARYHKYAKLDIDLASIEIAEDGSLSDNEAVAKYAAANPQFLQQQKPGSFRARSSKEESGAVPLKADGSIDREALRERAVNSWNK